MNLHQNPSQRDWNTILKRFSCAMMLGLLTLSGANRAAQADVILAQYAFTDGTANATIVDPSVTASSITANNLTFNPNNTTAPVGSSLDGAMPSAPTASVAGFNTTFDATRYLQFTLTPGSGGVDLSQFQFDIANGSTSTPRTLRVTYGFGASPTTFLTAGDAAVTATANQYRRFTFNLADQDTANNLTTDPITFRILGSTTSSTLTIRLDNVTVTAVPEPSTYAMFAIGLLALCFVARRRKPNHARALAPAC